MHRWEFFVQRHARHLLRNRIEALCAHAPTALYVPYGPYRQGFNLSISLLHFGEACHHRFSLSLLFPSKNNAVSLQSVEKCLFFSVVLLLLGLLPELLEMVLRAGQLEVVEVVFIGECIVLLGPEGAGPVVDELHLLAPFDEFQPLLALGLHYNYPVRTKLLSSCDVRWMSCTQHMRH